MYAEIPSSTLEKFTTFGDLLRFLRRRAGVTQLELSIAVGYSDAQISRLEQNQRLPDIPTVEALFVPALGIEDQPKAKARLLELAASVRREDAPGLGLCPYKGLNYFDEQDSDLFFGREALSTKLAERILFLKSNHAEGGERFLAIVGASGCGKSSLVRAGLIPALRWNKESANWPIYVITPTAHPLESLAVNLTQDYESVTSTATLIDDMAREPRSLCLFMNRMLRSERSDHLLLVVDQFEELFALCRYERERSAFINNLLIAASEVAGSALIVITLRADFYAHCSAYPHLRSALAGQQEYIGAMSDVEIRRAIEEPARRGRWEFEPGLVDLLLRDVGHEPGALPLLSHALLETWQRRRGRTLTLSGYLSSGGVRGAIAETAEAVFADQFNHEQRLIAQRIFLRLTELGDEMDAGDTRRRAEISELILKPEEADEIQTVIKALADARLVTTSENSIEVAHEALIREWPTLRTWLQDNREGLRLHRNIAESAQEWLTANRDPDLVYRGTKLSQARDWAATHMDDMNRLEHEFLAASIDLNECEAEEREAQRIRELEAAQKLADAQLLRAEEQAFAARQLRKRAFYLGAALIVALTMTIAAFYLGWQAYQTATTAQVQQRIASSRELAAEAISSLDIDPERSILLALHAVSATYPVDDSWTSEAEDALHQALLASRLQLSLAGHDDRVWAVAFSPDGRELATSSDDGTMKLWDVLTGREKLNLFTGAMRGRHGIAFSPDGLYLATASEVGKVKIWDATTGQEFLTLSGHTDWVSAVAFSPDGMRLATASEDRTAKIWDIATGQEIYTFLGHTGEVWDVAFSPDGKLLATASEDGKLGIWDSGSGKELRSIPGNGWAIFSIVFNPDGTRLASAGEDQIAKIIDTSSGEELLSLRGHSGEIWSVDFSPDGKRLATSSGDGKSIVWDSFTGQELIRLAGHIAPVTGVAFSPDCEMRDDSVTDQCGTRLATTSWDGTAKVWNTSFSRELLTLFSSNSSAHALSPDGSYLATGFIDGSVKVSDLSGALDYASIGSGFFGNTIDQLQTSGNHDSAVMSIVFSPDGKKLATGGEDQRIIVWDSITGDELLTLSGHTGGVHAIAFNPDGSRLATASVDYSIKIWDLSDSVGQESLTLSFPTWINAVTFSPDGKRLATAFNDGTAKVWDANSGEELLVLRGHSDGVYRIVFSPDGTRLATASDDSSVKIWDSVSGEELLSLRGHIGWVNGIAYSPDGRQVATSGQDKTAKLWDAQTGQELLTLRGHTGAVTNVAFSNDGARLFTFSLEDGTARFYLLEINDLFALANNRLTRGLTLSECQQFLHLPPEGCPESTKQEMEAIITPSTSSPMLIQPEYISEGKVCELTDESGLFDQFFNQMAYEGVLQATERFGWDYRVLETQQAGDYQKNITELLHSNCDLIVLPTGVFYIDAVKYLAEANPDQRFLVMDSSFDQPIDNVWTQTFSIDQAAFLAGYLAASQSKTGKVGTFGGVNFESVTEIMDGYALGVAYYNKQNDAHVEVLGWDVKMRDGLFTGNFVNTNDGRRMGEQLMDLGADIILPVAGGVGLGTAAVIKERGSAYLIGVDSDWALTYPEYADIILTSILKRLDASVVSAVQSIVDGTFEGGTHVGSFQDGLVSIAPFHRLDAIVSAQIKNELEQIQVEIVAGSIISRP